MQNKIDLEKRNSLSAFALIACSALCIKIKPQHEPNNAYRGAEEVLLEYIKSIFTTFSYAKDIGRKYLDLFPSNAKRDLLISQLLDQSIPGDLTAFKRHINAKRQHDFENENIIIIDGWPYSVCEAQLCALASFY